MRLLTAIPAHGLLSPFPARSERLSLEEIKSTWPLTKALCGLGDPGASAPLRAFLCGLEAREKRAPAPLAPSNNKWIRSPGNGSGHGDGAGLGAGREGRQGGSCGPGRFPAFLIAIFMIILGNTTRYIALCALRAQDPARPRRERSWGSAGSEQRGAGPSGAETRAKRSKSAARARSGSRDPRGRAHA